MALEPAYYFLLKHCINHVCSCFTNEEDEDLYNKNVVTSRAANSVDFLSSSSFLFLRIRVQWKIYQVFSSLKKSDYIEQDESRFWIKASGYSVTE